MSSLVAMLSVTFAGIVTVGQAVLLIAASKAGASSPPLAVSVHGAASAWAARSKVAIGALMNI